MLQNCIIMGVVNIFVYQTARSWSAYKQQDILVGVPLLAAYRTSAVLVAQVGKPPDIGEVDCEPNDGKEEVDLLAPRFALLVAPQVLHDVTVDPLRVIVLQKLACNQPAN